MSFVSQSNIKHNRTLFGLVLLIVVIAAQALTSQAQAAKSVHLNVLAHFGTPGLTFNQPGSQSQLYTSKGFKPSNKVGKIVKVKKGVESHLRKNERIVNAGYTYVMDGSEEAFQEKWNGKGVLPLTGFINAHGEKVPIRVTDVFFWGLIPNHKPYLTYPLM